MIDDAVQPVDLHPGDLFCHQRPHLVRTLLGSCVAVCLWDRRRRHGGMVHSVLPARGGADPRTAHFVDSGIDLLVGSLLRLGSAPRDLQAKLFGGADVLSQMAFAVSIGDRNVEAALGRLDGHHIPVAASLVGGPRGLVVKQNTATGEVWVRPVLPAPNKVTADDRHERAHPSDCRPY